MHRRQLLAANNVLYRHQKTVLNRKLRRSPQNTNGCLHPAPTGITRHASLSGTCSTVTLHNHAPSPVHHPTCTITTTTPIPSRSSPYTRCYTTLSPPVLPAPPALHPILHRYTSVRTKVFVSKHNRSLDEAASQITEYCTQHGIDCRPEEGSVRTTSSHVVLRECPFYPKPHGGQADNMFKLCIQIGGGGRIFVTGV